MIFDQFCGLVERHLPDAVPLLKLAHIFEFPGVPHETLPKSYDEETLHLLSETFFLPFNVVAVEDPASCVLLFDRTKDQQGISEQRFFAECLPLDREHLSKCHEGIDALGSDNRFLQEGLLQIAFGRISRFQIDGKSGPPLVIDGQLDRILLCDKRGVRLTETELMQRHPAIAERVTRSVLRNVMTAFEELFYFNVPSRFVVEKTVVKQRPPNPNTVIPRSETRPHFILLTPDQIRDTLSREDVGQDPGTVRKSPKPHHRRRHYRRLKSDRYKEARGKTVCVPAVWVGPEEGIVGPNRYRVRLDL